MRHSGVGQAPRANHVGQAPRVNHVGQAPSPARSSWRLRQLDIVFACVIAVFIVSTTLFAAENAPKGDSGIQVQLSTDGAGPREIEDSTEAAIVRDYGTAWKSLETALNDNSKEALDPGFVGFARDRYAARIADQKQSRLRTRIVDHGHKVQAIFYSPEGSTMQLRDAAQLEIQVLDGSDVVSSRKITRNYLAIMTTTEDRWKVRVLQETE